MKKNLLLPLQWRSFISFYSTRIPSRHSCTPYLVVCDPETEPQSPKHQVTAQNVFFMCVSVCGSVCIAAIPGDLWSTWVACGPEWTSVSWSPLFAAKRDKDTVRCGGSGTEIDSEREGNCIVTAALYLHLTQKDQKGIHSLMLLFWLFCICILYFVVATNIFFSSL